MSAENISALDEYLFTSDECPNVGHSFVDECRLCGHQHFERDTNT